MHEQMVVCTAFLGTCLHGVLRVRTLRPFGAIAEQIQIVNSTAQKDADQADAARH